jgi:hypothetical protein
MGRRGGAIGCQRKFKSFERERERERERESPTHNKNNNNKCSYGKQTPLCANPTTTLIPRLFLSTL